MKKVVKLKESDLQRIVKRVLNEQSLKDNNYKIKSGIDIYNQAKEKWGEDNFIIKKDEKNNNWVAHKNGDESDKIEISFIRKD
jgi:hypothetical protein